MDLTRGPTYLPNVNVTSHQRVDRGALVTFSDDNVMMKQVVATHSPDGRDVDVRPLLSLVEDILRLAGLGVDGVVMATPKQLENMDNKAQQVAFMATLESISFIIGQISYELSIKALSGGDAHTTTREIFSMLSNFPWDAKLVLVLAAFALNYGEFWLLAQIYTSNQLARSMAMLKQLPMVMEQSIHLKPRFESLNSLIRIMLDVAECIVDFKEFPVAYISQDFPAFSAGTSQIPVAVYWTIRSVVACATQIVSITSMGHAYNISTTESWEMSTLAHKLKNILEHLKKQISICYEHIEERRQMEAYNILVNLFNTVHIDNMKILKALIYARDDVSPLIEGASKRKVGLDVLRRKSVILLISGLNIAQEELMVLEQIYGESRQGSSRFDTLYEVVWIPIVDPSIQWTEATEKRFESLQSTMAWYSVSHPRLIDRAVIRFVREKWNFRNKPILVMLDPQGKVVCPNAIHMMWIWGSSAFPFTSTREEALWKDEAWRLELLVDGIDNNILNWIREGKYIFLYGGDDIEWIRKFTTTARQVAQAAKIPLEMVYVGKSNKREQVRRVISVINSDGLSSSLPDLTMVWFFWTRLESMLYSKLQLGRSDEFDPVMQEIKRILSYDREGGWAVLSKGSSVVVNGHGKTVLPTLLEYELWKEKAVAKGYDEAFKEHYNNLHLATRPCCRLEFSTIGRKIPDNIKCPECLRIMEKFTTFVCCHDEGVPTLF
ncbi:hypothetical protein MLD38_000136 [Melastoma candidum]|uniref:Uncharacterized protein n=1 Tax=Melastoma candidum TaxID=119954 RepID=A0ACB9SCE2_9MYRT|nr:hypothetical protein MLD38_000136 [Melastoma candidum]